jgi:hypothetical protein
VEHDNLQAKIEAALEPEIFTAFFQHYTGSLVPAKAAAIDFLKGKGIPEKSAASCLEILLKTGRQVGIVQEVSGRERILSKEHAIEQILSPGSDERILQSDEESSRGVPKNEDAKANSDTPPFVPSAFAPSLHVDIQIHISSDASAEQIEQIFASTAKHLYQRS